MEIFSIAFGIWLDIDNSLQTSRHNRMSGGLKASFQPYTEDEDARDFTSSNQECSRELVKQLI